jgi:hypothetical protein
LLWIEQIQGFSVHRLTPRVFALTEFSQLPDDRICT